MATVGTINGRLAMKRATKTGKSYITDGLFDAVNVNSTESQ